VSFLVNLVDGKFVEKTGLALILILNDDFSRLDQIQDTNLRLPGVIETESDHFLVLRYQKKTNQADPVKRKFSKVEIAVRKPNPLTLYDNNNVDSETFRRNVIQDLSATITH